MIPKSARVWGVEIYPSRKKRFIKARIWGPTWALKNNLGWDGGEIPGQLNLLKRVPKREPGDWGDFPPKPLGTLRG